MGIERELAAFVKVHLPGGYVSFRRPGIVPHHSFTPVLNVRAS